MTAPLQHAMTTSGQYRYIAYPVGRSCCQTARSVLSSLFPGVEAYIHYLTSTPHHTVHAAQPVTRAIAYGLIDPRGALAANRAWQPAVQMIFMSFPQVVAGLNQVYTGLVRALTTHLYTQCLPHKVHAVNLIRIGYWFRVYRRR